MKTSTPYGINLPVKTPAEAMSRDFGGASGKAKARYPHKPLGPGQSISGGNGPKHKALTPGTSPTGS